MSTFIITLTFIFPLFHPQILQIYRVISPSGISLLACNNFIQNYVLYYNALSVVKIQMFMQVFFFSFWNSIVCQNSSWEKKICFLQKCLSAKIRPRNFNTNIPTYKPFRYTANSDKWINEKTVFICSDYNGTSTLTRQHNSLIARKPDIYCLINIALMTKTEWTFQQRPCGLQTQQDFFCHKNLTLTMKYL